VPTTAAVSSLLWWWCWSLRIANSIASPTLADGRLGVGALRVGGFDAANDDDDDGGGVVVIAVLAVLSTAAAAPMGANDN
jgi:hypothetical protein